MEKIIDYTTRRLKTENKKNEAFIAQIKQEVSQEYDNLNNPVPFMPLPLNPEQD